METIWRYTHKIISIKPIVSIDTDIILNITSDAWHRAYCLCGTAKPLIFYRITILTFSTEFLLIKLISSQCQGPPPQVWPYLTYLAYQENPLVIANVSHNWWYFKSWSIHILYFLIFKSSSIDIRPFYKNKHLC